MIIKNIAPIFGQSASVLIQREGHLVLGTLDDFGSSMRNGFLIGVDIQPEGSETSILAGTGVSAGTSLVIYYNDRGVKGRIRVDLSDDRGNKLVASTQLSEFVAKRVFISFNFSNLQIDFYEFNIHETNMPLTLYERRDSLAAFSNFQHPFIVGGACIDGNRVGQISTKINNFVIYEGADPNRLRTLIESSRAFQNEFYGTVTYRVNQSRERLNVFKSDVEHRVEPLLQKDSFNASDTRICAGILFKWLFDRRPMLQDLCNQLGIQLTLPGKSAKARSLTEKAFAFKKPISYMKLSLGKATIFGHQWRIVSDFAKDPVFSFNQKPAITIKSFVLFVRHKLGEGHFDDVDRKLWQKELAMVSRYAENDRDFLNHHMQAVLRAVWEGVNDNRITYHLD